VLPSGTLVDDFLIKEAERVRARAERAVARGHRLAADRRGDRPPRPHPILTRPNGTFGLRAVVYTWYTGYMDTTASVREVRENLADVVERAAHDELTIITRRGREVAAIVPIEMVREYREWEEERVLRIINERRAAAQPGIPMDQIMNEVLESDE
jgi:prevent-host-death family protein